MERDHMDQIDDRELSTAPPEVIVSRAREDRLHVSLTPTAPPKISLLGGRPKLEKWIPMFKQHRDKIIAHLQSETEVLSASEEREVEMILGDVGACPHCGSVIAPEPHIQVPNFKTGSALCHNSIGGPISNLRDCRKVLSPAT